MKALASEDDEEQPNETETLQMYPHQEIKAKEPSAYNITI